MTEPRTTFEWPMYADATLAGLSVLIPLPFVDDVSESFFQRRIPRAIARSRGVELPEEILAELGRGKGWWAGWAALPGKLTIGLFKRLSRKLLYILTVKAASEQLSHYWLSAFLLDYMLASGHLESVESTRTAREAMAKVLQSSTTPMAQVARQVISRARHALPVFGRGKDTLEAEVMEEARSEMAAHWADFGGYLRGVAARYDAEYKAFAAAM